MAFVAHAVNELGPPFSMGAEYEEGRLYAVVRKSVEHARRRIGIGAIIKCESNPPSIAWKRAEHASKNAAVPMICPMCKSADQ